MHRMVNRINDESRMDQFFFALSDTTRRGILTRLSPEKSKTPRELADALDVSLPSLTKHLRALKKAGLIDCEKHGKSAQCFRIDELIRERLDEFQALLFKAERTGEGLPLGVTQEDEATLLWKEYRISRSPATREKLLDRYLHLVTYAAVRFSVSSNGDPEDLRRIGLRALEETLDANELLPDAKFERFLLSKIQEEFRRYFRVHRKKYKTPVGFFDKGETNISMARFQRIKKTFSASLKSVNENEILAFILGGLSERERLVLALRYMENFTLKKIGRVLRVTDVRISQIHSKAIKAIEQHFKELSKKETLGLV